MFSVLMQQYAVGENKLKKQENSSELLKIICQVYMLRNKASEIKQSALAQQCAISKN